MSAEIERVETTPTYDQRVFDLYDRDVKEQIAAFFREGRDPEDPSGDWREFITEDGLKAAIAAATNVDHTVKLTRWKKLPPNAFRRVSGPRRYRKKPIVISALQFVTSPDGTGTNAGEVSSFIGGGITYWPNGISSGPFHDARFDGVPSIVMQTLEGDHVARPGDWIIKGVKGEFYPCKPDIFEQLYDAMEDA